MAKKKLKSAARHAPPVSTPPAGPGPLSLLEGPRGRFVWLALFIVLFPLYLTCASREFGGGLGGDNVVYFLLGKALATGQGYVDLYLPGNPPHAKYPPGLPLLLAPFHLLFDQPLLPMHVMLIVFNTLAVVAAGMLIARMAGSRRAGLAAALMFGLGSRMYLQNLHVLSEPPYMFFCCLALLLAPKEKEQTLSPGRLAAIGLAATAAFFTRTMGIAVVFAVAAGLGFGRTTVAVKGRKLPAAPLAVAVWAAAFAAWSIRNHVAGAHGSYLDELLLMDPYHTDLGRIGVAGYFLRLYERLVYYYQQAAIYLVTDYAGSPAVARAGKAAGYALPFLMLAGLGLSVRRGERAVAAFVVATLGIIFSWSFIDPRFLAPVWPFLFYYLLMALDGLGRLIRLRRPWLPAAAVATAIVLFEILQLPGLVRMRFLNLTQPSHPVQVSGLTRPFAEPLINYAKYEFAPSVVGHPDVIPQRINFLIISRTVRDLTPPGSIILSRKPMYTYLLAGRQSVPFIFSEDPDRQWEYMTQNQVDYFVTGIGDEKVLYPATQKWPDRFQIIAAIGHQAVLFKVNRTTPRARPAETE